LGYCTVPDVRALTDITASDIDDSDLSDLIDLSTQMIIEDLTISVHDEQLSGNIDGCYDDQTMVLTKAGLKFFKDLDYDDEICTLNPETQEIEFQKPLKLVELDYNGEMYHFRTKTLDICVTPDHWMYVKIRKRKNNKDYFTSYRRIQAKYMKDKRCRFITTGKWKGEHIEVFKLGDLKLAMNDWLKFLGYYITDGTLDYEENTYDYSVKIIQKKESYKKMYEDTRRCFPELAYLYYNPATESFEITVRSKALHHYLKKLGRKNERFIPNEFLQLDKDQLQILHDALILGDGQKSNNHFWTCSRRLRDQMIELNLKLGRSASYRIASKKGDLIRTPRGTTVATETTWEIIPRTKWFYPYWFPRKRNSTRSFTIENYKGKVYCAIVPNHIMYIVRNGKPVWCGNTNTTFTTAYYPIADIDGDKAVTGSDVTVYQWPDSSDPSTRSTVPVSTIYTDLGEIVLSSAPASTIEKITCNYSYTWEENINWELVKLACSYLTAFLFYVKKYTAIPISIARGPIRLRFDVKPYREYLDQYYHIMSLVKQKSAVRKTAEEMTLERSMMT